MASGCTPAAAPFDVVNPADSTVVSTVSDAGPSAAQCAVEAAHGAFRER